MVSRRSPRQRLFGVFQPESECLEDLDCGEFSIQRVKVQTVDVTTVGGWWWWWEYGKMGIGDEVGG